MASNETFFCIILPSERKFRFFLIKWKNSLKHEFRVFTGTPGADPRQLTKWMQHCIGDSITMEHHKT